MCVTRSIDCRGPETVIPIGLAIEVERPIMGASFLVAQIRKIQETNTIGDHSNAHTGGPALG